MRIAILNCYLQEGRAELAETEATERLTAAASRMGIETAAFARSEDILDYRPDFVVVLSYHDAKLTPFPTYLLLTVPVRWMEGLPRFRRNILSADGWWTLAPQAARFVDGLCAKLGKPSLSAACTITPPRTQFARCDYGNALAAYIGTNWDGQRHRDLFLELARFGAVRCYGNRERWSYLPGPAYGGEVPFDGASALGVYRAAGVGLCLNHADFDAEAVPSNRMFEIPAASAVVIASRNPAVVDAYGDAVCYVDADAPAALAAKQIRDRVAWIRAHPKQAAEMAAHCHGIFHERFSIEAMLERALALHRAVCARLGFAPPASDTAAVAAAGIDLTLMVLVRDHSTPGLERCLRSVRAQTLAPKSVIVVDATTAGDVGAAIPRSDASWRLLRGKPGLGLPAALRLAEAEITTAWLGCIDAMDELYPNHVFAVADTLRRGGRANGAPRPAVIHSGMVQVSETTPLPELMRDDHQLARSERMRLVQFPMPDENGSGLRLHPSSCIADVAALRRRLGRRFGWPFGFVGDPIGDLARQGPVEGTGMVTIATHGAVRVRAG